MCGAVAVSMCMWPPIRCKREVDLLRELKFPSPGGGKAEMSRARVSCERDELSVSLAVLRAYLD